MEPHAPVLITGDQIFDYASRVISTPLSAYVDDIKANMHPNAPTDSVWIERNNFGLLKSDYLQI